MNISKQKIKGSVLISVLTIMMVVLILTMSALTLALSMNKRMNNKFADNQAYFSARSALNSTLACIQNYTGTEDDEYVQLAKQITALANGNTGDYFVATTTIELTPTAGVGVKDPVALRFENIDETKSLIKISATSNYAQVGNATVSIVLSVGDYKPSINFANALTTLGNADAVNIGAFGGSSLNLRGNSPKNILLKNDGKIIGSVIINGSATTTTQTTYAMDKGEAFVVVFGDGTDTTKKANLTIDNPTVFTGFSTPDTQSLTDNPYVFVSGNIEIKSGAVFGYVDNTAITRSTVPVDVHCNTITGSNNLKINGDLYIHGSGEDIQNSLGSINFTDIDINGTIYFDDPTAEAIFNQYIADQIFASNKPKLTQNDIIVGALSTSSSPTKDLNTMLTNIPDPYEAMQNFQQKNNEGNFMFEESGLPLLNEVNLCPASASSVFDYWDSTSGAYVIDTGDSDLINIDLSIKETIWDSMAVIKKPVVIKGTGKVNFYLPEGKSCQIENGSCILTEDLYEKYNYSSRSFETLIFESGEGSIKSPNINYYFAKDSHFIESNNCVIAGYVYGPEAKFTGMGVACSSLMYNYENAGAVNAISIIGSLITNEMEGGSNNFLAIYVPQGEGGNDSNRGADGSNLHFYYYSN